MWNRSEDSIFSEGRHYFAHFALSASLLMVLMGILAGAALGQTATPTAGPDPGLDSAIGVQFGEDNVQCVQNAVQEQTNFALSQYGDITQVNIAAIAQECNISVTNVEKIITFLVKKGVISDDGKKFVVDGDGKDDDAAHDQYDGDDGNDGDVITTPKEAKEGVLSDTIPDGKKVLPDTGGGGGMVISLPALGLLTLIVGGAASGLLLVRRR